MGDLGIGFLGNAASLLCKAIALTREKNHHHRRIRDVKPSVDQSPPHLHARTTMMAIIETVKDLADKSPLKLIAAGALSLIALAIVLTNVAYVFEGAGKTQSGKKKAVAGTSQSKKTGATDEIELPKGELGTVQTRVGRRSTRKRKQAEKYEPGFD